MKLIPGRQIADTIFKKIKLQAKSRKLPAQLAVILVGSNPASHLYVSIKEKRSRKIGIKFKKYLLPKNSSNKKIIDLIDKLNKDKKINAILVQLPLPKHLNANKIISTINPAKDADGIHPMHLKMLEQNQIPPVLPATTGAVIEALKYTQTNLKSKSIAIIGKSKIVGLPTYYYLKSFNPSLTPEVKALTSGVKQVNIYDSSTKNLASKTSKADILIVAIGSPKFITAKYVKKNATVIDVGINKVNSHTIGDVDLESVKNKARYLTPVPGGIGPITVAILLKNTLSLGKNQKLN